MVLLALFLVLHGIIHLLGFVKAFQLAELPQLTQPISTTAGILWLLSCLLFLSTATALFLLPRWWWAIGACAIVVSMSVIMLSWTDARFGALANLVAMAAVIFGFLGHGPGSLHAEYDRDVDRALARSWPADRVTEADLAHLPVPVQQYLRGSGVVGLPRVHNFRARMHGRIRSSPTARWIDIAAEQYNVIDEPARLFYLTGSMFLIPVQGYHRYVGPAATMRIKAAALVSIVDASGNEMNQGETVTLFNDICLMAPAALIHPGIVWTPLDARTARATFSNAGQTIHAELSFNEAGQLVNFRSDDRYQTSPDGKSVRKVPWSTPLTGYRSFGPLRLASEGEGRWHEAGGEYIYIELTIDDIQWNVTVR